MKNAIYISWLILCSKLALVFIFLQSTTQLIAQQNFTAIYTTSSCEHTSNGMMEIYLDQTEVDPDWTPPFYLDVANLTTGFIHESVMNDYAYLLENIPAGDYQITIELDDFCDLVVSTYVEQIPTTELSTLHLMQYPKCPNSTGSIWLTTPNNGITPYAYHWDNGSTTQNLLNVAPGTYCVSISDSECGYVEKCLQLDVLPIHVTLTELRHIEQCVNGEGHGSCSGFISVETNAPGSPQYTWIGPGGYALSSLNATNICLPGRYDLRVTFDSECTRLIASYDVCCCSDFTDDGSPPQQCYDEYIPLSVSPTVIPAFDGFNGAIHLDISGGAGIVSVVQWYYGGSSYPGGTSLLNLVPGEYCVSIHDGCHSSFHACYNVKNLSCDEEYTDEELAEIFIKSVTHTCPGAQNGSLIIQVPIPEGIHRGQITGSVNGNPLFLTLQNGYLQALIAGIGPSANLQFSLDIGECIFEFIYQMPTSNPQYVFLHADREAIECEYSIFCNGEYIGRTIEGGYLHFGYGESSWGIFGTNIQCKVPMYCSGNYVGMIDIDPLVVSGLEYWMTIHVMQEYIPHYSLLVDWFIYKEISFCDRVVYCPGDFEIMHIIFGTRRVIHNSEDNFIHYIGDNCVKAKCKFPYPDEVVCFDDLNINAIVNNQLPDFTNCGSIVSFNMRQVILWADNGGFGDANSQYYQSTLNTFLEENRHRKETNCATVTFCKNSFEFLYSDIESIQCDVAKIGYDCNGNQQVIYTCNPISCGLVNEVTYLCCKPGDIHCQLPYYVTVSPDYPVFSFGGAAIIADPDPDEISIRSSNSKIQGVTIMPNPFTNSVTIQIPFDEKLTLHISNVLGQHVIGKIQLSRGNNVVDLSSSPSGIYLCTLLETSGNIVHQEKLIKR